MNRSRLVAGMRARAETAMPASGMDAGQVVAWFRGKDPASGDGYVKLGDAMIRNGDRSRGEAMIRNGLVRPLIEPPPGAAAAPADAALQQVKLLVLYRELDVEHVPVVLLERQVGLLELGEHLARDAEALDASRHAGIDGDLVQDGLDLVLAHALRLGEGGAGRYSFSKRTT